MKSLPIGLVTNFLRAIASQRIRTTAIFIFAAIWFLPTACYSQSNVCPSYPNFASTNGLDVTGNATALSGFLRLTPASGSQVGNAWLHQKQPCAAGFDTSFHFRITQLGNSFGGEQGGDGITFSVQNVGPTNTVWGVGQTTNFVSVFFNTFWNWPGCADYTVCDVSDNSVGILTNQNYLTQVDLNPRGINLSDGAVHEARLVFDGSGLTVWVDNVMVLTNVSVPGLKPGTDAAGKGWVGFTALTGGAYENHDILDWSFCTSGSASNPPSIINQPGDQLVTVGSNATFSVAAFGTSPRSYQWQFNGTNLLSATNAVLNLTNVQPRQAGAYRVAVTNALGFAISSNAMLQVRVLAVFGNGQPLTNSPQTFTGPVTIQLQTFFPNGVVFYTLNGSAPSYLSTLYTGSFVLNRSATLRALAYSSDFFESGEFDPIAIVVPPFYSLSLSTGGGGTVAANPTPGPYLDHTVVDLTATPAAGWTFLKWRGDVTGTNPATAVTMNRHKSAQAVFGATLNTTAAGGGAVGLNPPGGVYPYGTTVQLSPIPQAGKYFVLWGNAASGNANPLRFTMTNANPTVSSLFAPLSVGQAALTVVPIGHGQVAVSPHTNFYALGSAVTLTATPETGQSFLGWSGDARGAQNPFSFTLNASVTLQANFTRHPHLAIGSVAPSEGVRFTVSGDPGEAYEVESSTNLVDWTLLGNLTNTFGTASGLDAAATNASQTFYRARLVP